MDILATPQAARHTRAVSRRVPHPQPEAVLSNQVSRTRYFFLDLAGPARGNVMPAYGGFEQCNPDYVVQRQNFAFPAIELVVRGEGTVRLNGQSHVLRAGSLFHYDRGARVEIRTNPARPMEKYFLCFTGARATARLREASIPRHGVVQLAMFAEVQRVLEELILEGRHHRVTTARICAALVEVLLLKIEELSKRAVPRGHAAEEAFLRCKDTIETHAKSLGRLEDITRVVGMSATQLNRLFRRYQGLSPYQYLLLRKMTLAAEMLMDPRALVKEAAGHVGFSDPYHFSRCFKKVHRVAPKAFQRALKVH